MNGPLTLGQLKRRYFTITSLFWFASVLPGATLVLFAQARGLDLLEIGFIFGAYGLMIVLLEVPTGGLADSIGRRRVTLIAVGVTLVSQLTLASAFSFWQFVAFAVIGGMGRALISGAPEAWFIDGLKTLDAKMDIQPPLAQAEVFSTTALAVGTLLGGFLPDLFAFLPSTETALIAPLSVPILASALCFIFLGITVFSLMLEPRTPPGSGGPSGLAKLPTLLKEAVGVSTGSRTILLLLLATLASGFALSGLETFWQPFFKNLLGETEGKTYLFGIILAGSFGLVSLGSLASIYLSKLLNKRYALVAALAEMAQGSFIVLLALQTNALVAAPLFWIAYFSRGVMNSPSATLLNNEVSNDKRSSVLSIQSLAFSLGAFFGSVGLGYVADSFAIRTAWFVAGGGLLVSLVCYISIAVHQNRIKP